MCACDKCETILFDAECSLHSGTLQFLSRSGQGDIVWCLAFLGTQAFVSLFLKSKKCSQCACKRGRKLGIHAFVKGWQSAASLKTDMAAVINPCTLSEKCNSVCTCFYPNAIGFFLDTVWVTAVHQNLHILSRFDMTLFPVMHLVWPSLRYTHSRIQSKYINE